MLKAESSKLKDGTVSLSVDGRLPEVLRALGLGKCFTRQPQRRRGDRGEGMLVLSLSSTPPLLNSSTPRLLDFLLS